MKTRQSMQKARKKLLVLMFTEMMEMPVIVPETEIRKIMWSIWFILVNLVIMVILVKLIVLVTHVCEDDGDAGDCARD